VWSPSEEAGARIVHAIWTAGVKFITVRQANASQCKPRQAKASPRQSKASQGTARQAKPSQAKLKLVPGSVHPLYLLTFQPFSIISIAVITTLPPNRLLSIYFGK